MTLSTPSRSLRDMVRRLVVEIRVKLGRGPLLRRRGAADEKDLERAQRAGRFLGHMLLGGTVTAVAYVIGTLSVWWSF